MAKSVGRVTKKINSKQKTNNLFNNFFKSCKISIDGHIPTYRNLSSKEVNPMISSQYNKIFSDLEIGSPEFKNGILHLFSGMKYKLPNRKLSPIEEFIINCIDQLNLNSVIVKNA